MPNKLNLNISIIEFNAFDAGLISILMAFLGEKKSSVIHCKIESLKKLTLKYKWLIS